MVHYRYLETTSDDHVFIHIVCEGRPDISIDILSPHGRRVLDVRVNGMGMFGGLLDVAELPLASQSAHHRFCSQCGEKLKLHSSRPHECSSTVKVT